MRISVTNTLYILIVAFMLAGCAANKKANILYNSGEYDKAIPKFKKAYSKAKKDRKLKAEIRFKIAECYRRTNNPKFAERYYKQAIRMNYPDPIAVYYHAEMLKMLQEYEEARLQYEKYKELVPDDSRGENGIQSIEQIEEWKENPTNHIVENMEGFNSRSSDFGPAYGKADYTIVYFSSCREGAKGEEASGVTGEFFYDIFQTRKDRKGDWSVPTPVSDTINTIYDEGSPASDSRFNTLYFTRCKHGKGEAQGCKIYKSTQSGGSWGPAEQEILYAKDTANIISFAHPSLSGDDLIMYFTADSMPGGQGGKDIWMVKRANKTAPWGDPLNLGTEINTPGDEMFPFIHNDTILYFSSNFHPGLGGLDIFKAKKDEHNRWNVENMGTPLNSPADDFGIIVEKEGEGGYFSSTREGGTGRLANDDIYAFRVPPIEITITGIVRDEETGEEIAGADVNILGSNGTSKEESTDAEGKFSFELKKNTDYIITTSKEGYFRGKAKETTRGINKTTNLETEISMLAMPITDKTTGEEKVIELENIEYDFDKWNLRPEAKVSLNKLVEILNENPQIVIELGSHTDHKGSVEHNDTLSQKRAQSVVNYLIEKGIERERLVAKGYGETKPKVVDQKTAKRFNFLKEGDILTEEYINNLPTVEQKDAARQINRRTEFKVISQDFKSKKERIPDFQFGP